MSIAFVLGGLVVAGVFAFVYIQNKKKKEQSNNANNGSSGNIPVSTPVVYTEDDNSSSGAGGYTPTENAPAEEHNTASANEPAVESIPNRDEEVQQSR
jgi:cytochrome bd-type quinol oxidase subunit 1